MSSYQYRKAHCGDKAILRPSYLYNGISYTGKTTSLYWIRARALDNTILEHYNILQVLILSFPRKPVKQHSIGMMELE